MRRRSKKPWRPGGGEMNHHPTADGAFAVSGARIFDGDSVRVDQAVLVEGRLVSDIVPRDAVPRGMTRYHEGDCTVLPGLIDTHVHFTRWQGPQFLAFGVTTVRDTGNVLGWILERRAEWGENQWPRILCLGPLLDGPRPAHDVVCRCCTDLADAVAAVREAVDAGVDGVKFYVGLDPEWLPAMAAAGHAAGREVSMHCAGGGVMVAADAGVDEFFHLDGILADIWPDHPPGWLSIWGVPEFDRTLDQQRTVADRLAESGITATPTLAYWDSQVRIRAADWPRPEEVRGYPSAMVEWQAMPPDQPASEQWRRALQAAQNFVGLLLDRGVPVLAGSDVPCGLVRPGLSLWRELALLAEAGMSPQQAIRAATADAAEFLGRRELGRLSPGSAADMVLVRGNPLEGIPAQPDIAMIVHNGDVYKPEDLLAAEEPAEEALEDEPWAVQFRHHWEIRNLRVMKP